MKRYRISRLLLAGALSMLTAVQISAAVHAQQPTNVPVVQVKDNNDAMRGIAPPKVPTFTKMTPKPGFARGMVQDASGKPIAGARIVLQASAAGGFRTDVKGKTNAKGIYEIVLPLGICEIVNADCIVRYNDRPYVMPLHPADDELEQFHSKEGTVEHFTVRTYGAGSTETELNPQFASGYYGGSVRLVWFHEAIPEGGTFEITLTPDGPLMGGVPSRKLVFRFPNNSKTEVFLNDIPVGRYTFVAKIVRDGKATPVPAKPVFGDEAAAQELSIEFVSDGSTMASLGRNTLRQVDISLTK
jgi:hypothetical protein